jgi:hypothetical protein
VRPPLEEEPFVLSPGPRQSDLVALSRAREAAPRPIAKGPEVPPPTGGRAEIALVGPGRNVPLVHARIAGQPTLMLVDTGSFDHLLEGWFARELQDAESSGKPAAVVDHANRKVAVERWTASSFAIDGWGALAPIRPLVTGDLTPAPRALGIGAILSPQRLARGATVVLDFPAGEMVAMDEAAATARLAAHPRSLGVALRCGASFAFSATVDRQDARLVLDTGSYTTDLRSTSPPGRALGGRTSVSHDVYAIGGPVATRVLGDASLVVGALTARLDVPVVADRPQASRCVSDGVLGMDVLARCVVAIDEMKMRASCD